MIKAPEKFTNLDRLVKASIMRHPIIFPSRIEVLLHLFLTNGNGYEWNFQTGDIEDAFGNDMYAHPVKIDSDQLSGESDSDYLGNRFQAVKHQFIEDNIDEIATNQFSHETCEASIHRISRNFSEDYTLIGQLLRSGDVTKINRVWRDGIIELAKWFVQEVRVFHSLHALDDQSSEEDYIDGENIKTVEEIYTSISTFMEQVYKLTRIGLTA